MAVYGCLQEGIDWKSSHSFPTLSTTSLTLHAVSTLEHWCHGYYRNIHPKNLECCDKSYSMPNLAYCTTSLALQWCGARHLITTNFAQIPQVVEE